MTLMIDTEGDELPNAGQSGCWDINLWGNGMLSLLVPMYFEVNDGGSYNSGGVLQVGLRELLSEYLVDNAMLDGGDGLLPLALMLREFAEKYEVAAQVPNAELTGRGLES